MGKRLIRAAAAAAALGICFFIWRWAKAPGPGPLPEAGDSFYGMGVLEEEDLRALLQDRRETGAGEGDLVCRGIPCPRDPEGLFHVPVLDLGTGGETDPADQILWPGREGRLYVCREALPEDIRALTAEGKPLEAWRIGEEDYSRLEVLPTGLPILTLTYDERDPIRGKEDHQGVLALLSGDSASSWETPCLFHMRGNTSTFYDKKSYRVSLKDEKGKKKAMDLLGIRKDDDWILNPLLTDTSRIREKTAYELWACMQEILGRRDFSSGIRYAEVFMNGEPAGIYGLMVPVDKKLLSLRKGDLLYKINTWEVPSPEEYAEYAFQEEVLKPNGISYMDLKYPKPGSGYFSWQVMEDWQGFVYGDLALEDLEEKGLSADRESLAVYTLFCMLTHAMDNTWKNSFLIARRQEDGTYVLGRTIWDLNYTFGDIFAGTVEDFYTDFRPDTAEALVPYKDTPYDWQKWAGEDPEEAGRLLKKTWTNLREGGLTPSLAEDLMDKNAGILEDSGAISRERILWPEPGADGSAAPLKKWIRARFSYLDEYFGYPAS